MGKYGRKISRIVIRYGQHGRKSSWNVKWYGKYGRKVKRFENTEENCEKIWKIWKKSKFFYKTINTACNLFKFTLCPTVRGNNSVSEGVTL